MIRRSAIVALVALSVAASALDAQVAERPNLRNRPGAVRPNRRPLQEPPAGAQPQMRRQQLEQQIRRQFWRVAKQRIGFTDDQMFRLERATQRFDQRRREIGLEERTQRIALRTETLRDSAANQNTIAAALDQLHQLQLQRLELQAEEQKELATFMTPLQRARFFALQEQVRKRMQEVLRSRSDSAARGLPDLP